MASEPLPPTSGPDEVESTISRLSNYRNVHGVMILSRQGGVIRTEGTAFEGDQGRVYARAVKGIVEGVRTGIVEVDEGVSWRLGSHGAVADGSDAGRSSAAAYTYKEARVDYHARYVFRQRRIVRETHHLSYIDDKYLLVVLQEPS